MTRVAGAFLALFLLVSCAAEVSEAAAASASGWAVDKSKSSLSFTAEQAGASFTGAFNKFDASIDFDPGDLSGARIEVIVDMASAKTGDRQRDAALPTTDWFAVKSFPMAVFSATEVISTGENTYEARGRLTIRDAFRDLALPFTLTISGDRAVADGAVSLVRTNFGVGQGEFASGEWVGLEVLVEFHVEATR